MAHVQKRLGHASIQTTVDTYVHLTEGDLKEEYQNICKKERKTRCNVVKNNTETVDTD